MPVKKVGSEKPMKASVLAIWSKSEYGRVAAYTPTGSAMSSASTCEEPMISSVTGMRCRISVSTSTRLAKEKPQLPCTIEPTQRR